MDAKLTSLSTWSQATQASYCHCMGAIDVEEKEVWHKTQPQQQRSSRSSCCCCAVSCPDTPPSKDTLTAGGSRPSVCGACRAADHACPSSRCPRHPRWRLGLSARSVLICAHIVCYRRRRTTSGVALARRPHWLISLHLVGTSPKALARQAWWHSKAVTRRL